MRKKKPKVLVITENIVTNATALKIDFILVLIYKQNQHNMTNGSKNVDLKNINNYEDFERILL